MPIAVERLDHLVLTCADLEATAAWYERALGMRRETFGGGRTALHFGTQKINLHQQGRELKPNAATAAPGTADLCFIAAVPTDDAVAHLRRCDIAIDLMPRQQAPAPMGVPANRPENQLFGRMPDEHESWVLSGSAYTTFRASNAMTLDQMVGQMLAHGVPASSAEKAAPQVLRALKSMPIRYGAAVVALGAGGWALYQHFFSRDEKPVSTGTLK